MAGEDDEAGGSTPDSPVAAEPEGLWAWGEALLRFLTVVVLGLVAVVPIVGNELRVQDVDPTYTRNLVERAARFGGTYYENAIHNRGSLEPVLYDLAHRITSFDGFWFAISAMVAIIAAVVAAVAAVTARWTGANRSVALGVGVVAYVQLALAGHGWSRVLYIRNITTLLLCLVWALALSEGRWDSRRRALWSSVLTGALLGCVVEQLLTTVFAGAVVGLVALALLYERRPPEERGQHLFAAIVAAIAAFVATPVWYLARGSFGPYWEGWWTYARYMGAGPGRSLVSQLRLGWDQWYDFHRQNPLVVLLLLGFLGLTWLLWEQLDRRRRIVHVGLLAWWAAGWCELALSQRYSAHYYIVAGMPTLLIGAATAGHVAKALGERRPTRLSLAVPLAAAVLGVYLTSPKIFHESVTATVEFDGVAKVAAAREKNLGGSDRSTRAILDLVSHDGDALLAWTFDPSIYPRLHRVPATRFQWKWLLQGAIYLGRTSPDFVLPDTWRWFREDLAESHPAAFAETEPYDPGTPFAAAVERDFVLAYPGATKVWLRRDLARQLLTPPAGAAWAPPLAPADGSGWSLDGPVATYTRGAAPTDADRLPLTAAPCTRIDGVLTATDGSAGPDVVFHLERPTDEREEPQYLALEGDSAGSGSLGLGALGFESVPSGTTGPGPIPFSIVVGDRSAALVVAGQIRGAVRLRPGVVALSVESRSAAIQVSDLRTSAAPAAGGCPSTAQPTG
jgi:hypothetical protein